MAKVIDIKIRFITGHAGRRSSNGGEYGYGYTLHKVGEGAWEKRYWTTADFDFCWVDGIFQECRTCSSFLDGECIAKFEILTDEEVKELVKDREVFIDWEGTPEIDLSGHEPEYCRYDGGCIVCHPCGHEDCGR
jgi:hypothetical protein